MGYYPTRLFPQQAQAESHVPPVDYARWDAQGEAGFLEGFKRENWGTQFTASTLQPMGFRDDSSYDAPEDAANEGYPLEITTQARSASEAAYLRHQYDTEMESLTKIRDAQGWGTLGSGAGAVASPQTPIGFLAKGFKAVVALETTLEAGAEVARHQFQLTRTKQETAFNVAATLGGTAILGGAMKLFPGGPKALKVQSEEGGLAIIKRTEDIAEGVDDAGLSVGAKKVEGDITNPIEADGMTGGFLVEKLSIGPLARVLQSASETARLKVQQLVESAFGTKGNLAGRTRGTSVEADAKVVIGRAADTINQGNKNWKASQYISRDDFNVEVARAMRDGGEHADEFVKKTAKLYQEQITGKLYDDLVAAKLIKAADPEDMADGIKVGNTTVAKGYFPRVYNDAQILDNWDALRNMIEKELMADAKVINAGLDASDLEARVASVMQNMMGGLPIGSASKGAGEGVLSPRVVQLLDEKLAPFLENNAEAVLMKHVRAVAPHLEMQKKFGDRTLNQVMLDIRTDYDGLINKAGKDGDTKKVKALEKQLKQDLMDFTFMRDRILSKVQTAAETPSAQRVIQGVQMTNAAIQMGGVVLTSVPDLVRPLSQYGFKSFAAGTAEYFGKLFTGKGALTKSQANKLGVATERQLSQRAYSMADIGDVSSKYTDIMGRWWIKLSMFDRWTDMVEGIAAQTAMDWTLRQAKNVTKGVELSPSAKLKLGRMGLDAEDLKVIHTQAERAGGMDDAVLKYGNTAQWDDLDAAKLFSAAIGSDVRRVIVRPGAGDKPLAFDAPMLKLLAQYQGFAVGASNRMLAAGLQHKDLALAQGLVASMALGAFVGATKAYVRGDDPTEWETSQWFTEGLDRSGWLGVYRPMLSALQYGLGQKSSRFIQRDMENVFGSPTLSTLAGGGRVLYNSVSGNYEEAGKQALKITPFLNSMHFRDVATKLAED